MVKTTEEKKDVNEEKKDIFKTWTDSYTAVSKMWEDSYLKLYKPWIESTGEMFEKTSILSKEATPQKYKEFYDEWIKTYQNTFGKRHLKNSYQVQRNPINFTSRGLPSWKRILGRQKRYSKENQILQNIKNAMICG